MKTLILLALIASAGFGASRYTDYTCVSECTARGYMYGLCVKMCSY